MMHRNIQIQIIDTHILPLEYFEEKFDSSVHFPIHIVINMKNGVTLWWAIKCNNPSNFWLDIVTTILFQSFSVLQFV